MEGGTVVAIITALGALATTLYKAWRDNNDFRSLRAEVALLKRENAELKAELDQVRKENHELREQNTIVNAVNAELRKLLDGKMRRQPAKQGGQA